MRLQENTMQQVFSCTRASHAIVAMTDVGNPAITSQRRFADSESRLLATKIFS
jgi:hypothetical protein